jgi:CRP-like cAMP-binding protein
MASVAVIWATMPDAVDGAALRPLSILEGASAENLEDIARMMSITRASAGEVLGREGEPGDTFWLVLAGTVAVSRATSRGERAVAVAHPGSIVGELAVLRHSPRTATVTAREPTVLACGGPAVLERMLAVEPVRNRIRRLASDRLAHDLHPLRTVLPDGTAILVRPLLPEDREGFDTAIHQLSRESLRRRFFSPAGPSKGLVDYLLDLDYVDHFAWVAVDAVNPTRGLATARYIRTARPAEAEMAFGTIDDYQGRGIGTFLLGALGVAAGEAGITTLVAHVLEDNAAMRKVFSKAAAAVRFDEPGVIFVEIEATAAAALLDDSTRTTLASTVRDVVTAASLALTPPAP